MEFVVGWTTDVPTRIGRLLSIPEQLLALLGCATAQTFLESIELIEVNKDPVHTYVRRHAVIHIHTAARSAVLSSNVQILPMKETLACIGTIYSIEWRDDHSIEWVAQVESRIRLGLSCFRKFSTNDNEYIAQPIYLLPPMTTQVRDELKRRQCVFNHNVVYTLEAGSKTHRSILFPASMIDITPVDRSDWYSVFLCTPNLVHILTSQEFLDTLDASDITPTNRMSWDEIAARFHSYAEMTRIQQKIIPDVMRQKGGVYPIEFIIPTGRVVLHVDVTVTASYLICVYNRSPKETG